MGDLKGSYRSSADDAKGIPYKDKPGPLETLVSALKKLLCQFLRCVTCGCYPGAKDELHGEVYEAYLMEEERIAVENLLAYLDSFESKEPWINEERLRALCILTYSDNQELQRSASLCFAELSERMRKPVTMVMLEPLVVLLQSKDITIQKAASLAISNFALHGPEENKTAIVGCGAVDPLVALLSALHPEVQCNTCGCITTLATNDSRKQMLVDAHVVPPMLSLAMSSDIRVQRNATGALLNLSHPQSNRNKLVSEGALPILVQALHSSDADVQYYVAAALSNLAVTERHRAMMVAVGYRDVIRQLVVLLGATSEKVKCQSCLALRNLASDTDTQLLLVKMQCLPSLHTVIQKARGETLAAAMACTRNLSIHRSNETHIIQETFLVELRRIVRDGSNPTAQIHAAGTIRNLAAGDQIQRITRSGCVESLLDVIVSTATSKQVLVEVTAALAVLADDDDMKEVITRHNGGSAFTRLVALAANSDNLEICYNAAGILGQVALAYLPDPLLLRHCDGMLQYLHKFLTSSDASLIHIALWTLVQLLKYDIFIQAYQNFDLQRTVDRLLDTHHTDAITELAHTVIRRSTASSMSVN